MTTLTAEFMLVPSQLPWLYCHQPTPPGSFQRSMLVLHFML